MSESSNETYLSAKIIDGLDFSKLNDIPVHSSPFESNDAILWAINQSIIPVLLDENLSSIDQYGFITSDKKEDEVVEDSNHKMKFLALIEFAHEIKDTLLWSQVELAKINREKLEEQIREGGIPHSMRPFLWTKLTGADKAKAEAPYSYKEVLKQAAVDRNLLGAQYDRRLMQALPDNVCFRQKNSPGIMALKRILKSITFLYPDLVYSEGLSEIVAVLLLVCPEETAFWIVHCLVETILPPHYFTQTLLGVQADERIVECLMKTHLPDLSQVITDNEVEISIILLNWFRTMLAACLPISYLLRIWDFIFLSGSVNMFRVIISILKMNEDDMLQQAIVDKSSATLFNALNELPSKIKNISQLIEYMISFEFTITDHLIKELRKKHQAVLMADHGMIINTLTDTNLPKQTLYKRKLRSEGLIKKVFQVKDEKDVKLKNVRQTEIIVDLKESVMQICRYFMSCDESLESAIETQADYNPESHLKDMEVFKSGRRKGQKRARALLDFARQDEDELGFRKNDIITIVSEKDEHCWVGEINGLRGWFPAKFVQVVDERGKNYTVYGDENVCPEITEYIRGRLANNIRQIMDHGMKESVLYPTQAYHPWQFIEEVANNLVKTHYTVVYSRLMLCSSFNLDQDEKVLTPEELMFKAVQQINDTHNLVGAHADIKLRSFIVAGVNEQCLHLWFELLCAQRKQQDVRDKYYNSWAFIRTPAWKQIKCDLRLLAQFAFNLSIEFEIADFETKRTPFMKLKGTKVTPNLQKSDSQNTEEPLKKGVTDMLIRHSLYSWEL